MLDDLMNLAIEQAKLGGIDTYKNPLVGAVLVKNNKVIATGYHHRFGGDHAEVDTLKKVTDKEAKDATLVVTLEPCSHYGKTPPCCERIVEAGIKKVVIGQLDPHPIVGGKGKKYLLSHGVEVIDGVLRSKVEQLNTHYNLFYRKNRPWITLKAAMTFDGKINQAIGKRTLISNHESYLDSQKLRMTYQAILIGENTLKIDNPQLTVRLKSMNYPPVRLVVLNHSEQALDKNVIDESAPTWLLCRKPSSSDAQLEKIANVHVVIGDWTPRNIIDFCYRKGWQSLLVEGGSTLQAAFINQNLVDEWIEYLAPEIFGGDALAAVTNTNLSSKKIIFERPRIEQLGTDIKIQAIRKRIE